MYLPLALLFAALATAAAANGPFASFDRASDAVLNDPHDLEIGPDGRLYVADKLAGRIVVMDPDTLEIVGTIGDGDLPQVRDVSFAPDGTLWAAVTGANAVVSYTIEADGSATFGGALGPFPRTEGMLAHSNGRLYVMASGTGQLFAVEGETPVAAVPGLFGAHDVAEAPDGTIYVADNARARVVQFDQELTLLKVFDAIEYGFFGPRYLAFDEVGRLVVADQDAHRVVLIEPASGALLGTLGTGVPGLGPNLFDDPEGAAARGGTYWFSDSDNNRVVRYVVLVN